MAKKVVQTPEEKILKHLQGRKLKVIKTKDVQKITGLKGSVGYKTSAKTLARMCKEGKLTRTKIGVYELLIDGFPASFPKPTPRAPIEDTHTRRYHALTMEEKDYYIKLRHEVRSLYGIEFDQVDKSTGLAKELCHKNVSVADAAQIVGTMYKLEEIPQPHPAFEALNDDQFNSPEEKEVETNSNHTMQNNNHKPRNHKNYTFNNCTVTINEEGKAIEILQQKQDLAGKKNEAMMAIANTMTGILSTYLDTIKKENQQSTSVPGKLPKVDKTKIEKFG